MRGLPALTFLLLALPAPGCGMSDGGFFGGSGTVTGTVTQEGRPAAGVEVAVAGTSLRTASDAQGRFRLAGVAAGLRTVIARDATDCLASRAELRVAAGWNSSAGVLELEPAGRLELKLVDPQLPVTGCELSLAELPRLRATSDAGGLAGFDCLPAGACYTARVLYTPLPFSFPDAELCLPSAPPWPANKITPSEDNPPELARGLNVLRLAALAAGPLLACRESCAVPSWWLPEQGPPCPLALGEVAGEAEIKDFHDELKHLRNLNRLEALDAPLACPPAGVLGASCREGTCRLEQPAGPSARILWQGGGLQKCATYDLTIFADGNELNGPASCLGFEPPAAGGPFVLLRHKLDIEATAVVAVEDPPGSLDLYLEARLPEPARILPDEVYTYLLAELSSPPAGLAAGDVSAAVSWVLPGVTSQ